MKTIIVPTDFSANADKALKYAAILASKSDSNLIIHHSFDPLFTSNDLAGGAYGFQHSEQAAQEQINERISLIHLEQPDLKCSSSLMMGGLVEDLQTVYDANEDAWLILGTQGASGLKKALIGSSSVAVINHLRVPTIIIPEAVKMNEIKKIAFASDYEPINDDNALDPLKEIAMLHDAEVHIVNVHGKDEVSTFETSLERNREGYILGDEVKHKFVQMIDGDVEEGLSYYLNNVDNYQLLAMVKRSHNLFDQIIGASHTSEMAFEASVPLLILHNHN